MTAVVLAADPGSTCGFCLLAPGCVPLVYACNHAAAYGLACFLIEANDGPATMICAGEAFVPGRGAGARQAGAAVTRALIADLSDLTGWHWRSAAMVKPWARLRLKAAGLYDVTAKTADGRDAAMHAIFAGVHDCGWPDPLSKDGPAFWKGMTA